MKVEEVYVELETPVVVEVTMEKYIYLRGGMRLRGIAPLALPPLLKSSFGWIYPHPSFVV